jgi:hypothetical protein
MSGCSSGSVCSGSGSSGSGGATTPPLLTAASCQAHACCPNSQATAPFISSHSINQPTLPFRRPYHTRILLVTVLTQMSAAKGVGFGSKGKVSGDSLPSPERGDMCHPPSPP